MSDLCLSSFAHCLSQETVPTCELIGMVHWMAQAMKHSFVAITLLREIERRLTVGLSISGKAGRSKDLAKEIPEIKSFQRRPAGSPKKLRRREADELPSSSRVSRRNRTMTCTRCLKTGHNARSYKGPVHPNSRFFCFASSPMAASQPASQPMAPSEPESQPMAASQPIPQRPHPMPAHRGRVRQASSQPLPASQPLSSTSNSSGRGKIQAKRSTSTPKGRGRIGAGNGNSRTA